MTVDKNNAPCYVRLRNKEEFILSRDGWNPHEEIPAYGPLWSETAQEWTLDSDEIIMYRAISQNEVRNWRNSTRDQLRRFLDKYVGWDWLLSDLPKR